jgi:hypothetical protein
MRAWLAVVVLAGCGNDAAPLAWGIGTARFDARAFGLGTDAAPDPVLAAIPAVPRLAIATYDGSGQVVHPDVLLDGGRVLLALTPYPDSDDRFENPSLYAGDGVAFEPLRNDEPIVPPPPFDHNDDPDLRKAGDEYELLYLETLRPQKQTVVALRSRDLATWQRRDAIVYDLEAGDTFIVSPAAIRADDGTTAMFYVDVAARAIEVLHSADGRTWDTSAAQPIAIDMHGVTPWHVDVVRGERGFALLISGYTADFEYQDLYLATSPDLVTWTLVREPLLARHDVGAATLYRSTGLVSGSELVVWYSMEYE